MITDVFILSSRLQWLLVCGKLSKPAVGRISIECHPYTDSAVWSKRRHQNGNKTAMVKTATNQNGDRTKQQQASLPNRYSALC